MFLRFSLFIFLLSILFLPNQALATEYKFINGRVVPLNPLDQADGTFEIDNQSIVQALISYRTEMDYLKEKIKRMDKDIYDISRINSTFKKRMDKFTIQYNRRF